MSTSSTSGTGSGEHGGGSILQALGPDGPGGELTVALVDLSVAPEDAEEFGWVLGREFRSDVKEIASIEANLSIANMDFDEFADGVDADGVFRGF